MMLFSDLFVSSQCFRHRLGCDKTCGDKNIIPRAEELNITKRCIQSLAVKASTNPNLFGWPMIDHGGPMQSPSSSLLWNGISTGARPVNLNSDRWVDDVFDFTSLQKVDFGNGSSRN
ncbi:putative NPH3/RPT2-like family protein [Helianthus debilis subsp. tardiflorus]